MFFGAVQFGRGLAGPHALDDAAEIERNKLEAERRIGTLRRGSGRCGASRN
jgi:hypothetical protein